MASESIAYSAFGLQPHGLLTQEPIRARGIIVKYPVIVIAKILLSIFNFHPTDPTVTWKGYMISLFIGDIRSLGSSPRMRCFLLPKV